MPRGNGKPDTAFRRGLQLLRGRRYFEAHEELELAWRAAEAGERDFFQGLVHVSVAWYQAGRGRRVGAERQLEKAARRLASYAPLHRDIDVAGLLEQVAAAERCVRRGSLDFEALSVRRFRPTRSLPLSNPTTRK